MTPAFIVIIQQHRVAAYYAYRGLINLIPPYHTIYGMFEVCQKCLAGRHAEAYGSSECDRCPRGQYSPSTGWGEPCLYCMPGSVASSRQSGCTNCTIGSYWSLDGEGVGVCQRCPAGTTNSNVTAGSIVNCLTCPSVSSNPTRTNCLCDTDPNKAQHECPEGYTCPSNTPGQQVECIKTATI